MWVCGQLLMGRMRLIETSAGDQNEKAGLITGGSHHLRGGLAIRDHLNKMYELSSSHFHQITTGRSKRREGNGGGQGCNPGEIIPESWVAFWDQVIVW
mmetsp:Transcript_34048/g.69523  ORF Transcript_34048/g.69523 Transcript_34048/m.69523 type:complete len:98 (-) Transcript_34048:83-376(-)